MWLLILGSAILILPGAWALMHAERDLVASARLGPTTFAAAFLAYVGHAVVTLIAAWGSVWPMPIGRTIAVVVGGTLAMFGGAVYLAARLQFRSFRLTWGLESSHLVTAGIYKYSRNPQVVGAVLFLLGVAVVGRSLVAVALVGLLCLSSLVWLPREERALEHIFGDEYRNYQAVTPRFLGILRSSLP